MKTALDGQDKEHYQVFFSIVALLFAVILVYKNTYWSMVETWWRSGTFNHGFIILPISLYLIWRRRFDLYQSKIKPDFKTVPLLIVLVCLWLVASIASVLVLQQLAAVLMIPVVIWALFGWQFVKTILFPLAYLLFMVPFGEFLVPLLQDVTAEFAVWVLRLSGIPVLMEGRFLYLPSGSFEVAEACSGIRYLIATLSLGTLYAYITYHSYYRRFVFILLSIIIPIMANAMRAYGIIMLAHLSGHKLAVGVDHIIYGWLFFGLVILIMFWAGGMFRDKPIDNNNDQRVPHLAGSKPVFDRPFAMYAGSLIVILIIGPASAGLLNRPVIVLPPDFSSLSSANNQWQLQEYIDPNWQPKFVGPLIEKHYISKNAGKNVQLYIAYYESQQQGKELVNSENRLYDRQYWKRVSDSSFLSISDTRRTLSVNETVVSSTSGGKVIWFWYEVSGKAAANPIAVKLYEVQSRLQRSNLGSAAVVVAADFQEDINEARKTLQEFVEANLEAIHVSLGFRS